MHFLELLAVPGLGLVLVVPAVLVVLLLGSGDLKAQGQADLQAYLVRLLLHLQKNWGLVHRIETRTLLLQSFALAE